MLGKLSERTGSPKDLSPEIDDESVSEIEKKMIAISTVDLKKSVDERQKQIRIFEASLKSCFSFLFAALFFFFLSIRLSHLSAV